MEGPDLQSHCKTRVASIGILRNINREVLNAHLVHCVKQTFDSGDRADKMQKMNEIILVMDKLAK